jgi:hypothetical protein
VVSIDNFIQDIDKFNQELTITSPYDEVNLDDRMNAWINASIVFASWYRLKLYADHSELLEISISRRYFVHDRQRQTQKCSL